MAEYSILVAFLLHKMAVLRPISHSFSANVLKVIRFIGANIGKLDALHTKITAAYNLWSTIYEAVKPLLPAQAVPVVLAPEAPAPVVDGPAADPGGPEVAV